MHVAVYLSQFAFCCLLHGAFCCMLLFVAACWRLLQHAAICRSYSVLHAALAYMLLSVSGFCGLLCCCLLHAAVSCMLLVAACCCLLVWQVACFSMPLAHALHMVSGGR